MSYDYDADEDADFRERERRDRDRLDARAYPSPVPVPSEDDRCLNCGKRSATPFCRRCDGAARPSQRVTDYGA